MARFYTRPSAVCAKWSNNFVAILHASLPQYCFRPMQLSKHLVLSQLDQPAGYGCAAAPYPQEWIAERAVVLASVVDVVYQEFSGRPLMICSGYRSREFNEALLAAGYPVAENSQHCEGRAIDIAIDGVLPTEVYSVALHSHRRGIIRLGGLGLYAGWVHFDIRPGPLKQWFG
jgi:hypothetical protein